LGLGLCCRHGAGAGRAVEEACEEGNGGGVMYSTFKYCELWRWVAL
jgi:hypothetical protein